MYLNFIEAIAALGPNAAFRIANAVRPPANYLFNTLLPERNMTSYYVDSGNMTVRATMAGLVGMDSPYPPGGMVEASTFLEQSAKLAIDVPLHEGTLRQIQEMLNQVAMGGGSTKEALSQEALNFLNKVVLQALMDRAEWLRGQALVTGAIDWTFNQKNLLVDYGIPAANFLTSRTGNDAYNGSASKFWTDVRAAQQKLRYSVRAVIAHSNTINAIVDNSVNATLITSQSVGGMSIRRYNTVGGNTVPSPDARDLLTLIAYDEEGEIFDPTDPSSTITIPFMPTGKLLFIGNNNRSGYRVGQGSTDDPTEDLALGYTHIAPTVEGGSPGRWSRLFTPEGQPWQLRGQGVQNLLPVIEAPKKVVVATSTIA
jgi:Phage major capsid protein E